MKILKDIYKPIEKDLEKVSDLIGGSFRNAKNRPIAHMGKFLLGSPGKRLRPALVILSAKAIRPSASGKKLIRIASAVELIHMASLLHDDVIDHSSTRHNKPTVNSKWGGDAAIALGGYLYSAALELISECGDRDIIRCINSATKTMCEGELIQVCERNNPDLLKERYFVIVKKKTAGLFAASCRTGAIISKGVRPFSDALTEYGLNFGIAFQIADDYLDLVEEEKKLGKKPGQDIGMGEMTLPVLNLLESAPESKRETLKKLFTGRSDKNRLKKIRSMLFNSEAGRKTKEAISAYSTKAREKLGVLPDSKYKKSLSSLIDFTRERTRILP